MKQLFLCFILIISTVFLSSCIDFENPKIQSDTENTNSTSISPNEDNDQINILSEKRNEVIKRFKNERKVIGTGRFIEDTYNQFPDDEVISVIYYYMTAVDCRDFYQSSSDNSWLEEAKLYAAKIPSSYNGVFADEIIPFVQDFLGDEWAELKEKSEELEHNFDNLTLKNKVEIYNFVQSKYDHYDKLEGKNTGDKYSDNIFEETASKYNISVFQVKSIWNDTDVLKEANSQSLKSSESTKPSGSTSYTQTPTDDEMGFAWAAAKQEVKGKLKAPSTAKFPTYNDATIKKNGKKFKVVGYVDAENSYGAKLRVTFTVEFEKTGEESYIPISVILDE